MALIDATAGGAAANSYADVAAADTFLLQERLGGSAWDEVADKPAALIMATQQLERFSYIGNRNSTTQALAWPRTSAELADGPVTAANAIPVGLIRATCELALWLTQGDRTGVPAGESVSDLTVGPIKLTLRDPVGGLLAQLPDVVKGHLQPYLLGGTKNSSLSHKVMRA